jgi:FkbM family methyltransferase
MFGLGIRKKLAILRRGFVDCASWTFYERTEFHKLVEAHTLSTFLTRFEIDCVIDVGANRGQYATALRENARYRGHIISVEPIPEVFAELASSAARDPLWHCENCALSDSSGCKEFHVMQGDQFSSFLNPTSKEFALLQERNSVSKSISVKTKKLDLLFEQWQGKIGFARPFLKLDTQGYDHVVVSSGKNVVSQFVGIQSEIAFKRLYTDSLNFHEAMVFMDSLGFSLSSIFPNNAGHFPDCVEQDAIFYNKSFQVLTTNRRST